LFWPGCDAEFAPVRWIAVGRLLSWYRDSDRARRYLDDPALAAPQHRIARKRMAFLAGQSMLTAQEYIAAAFQSPSASPRTHQFGLQLIIEYHCFRNQWDEAVATLHQLAEYKLADLHWLDCCPLLAPLRSTAEFLVVRAVAAELVQKIQHALGIGAD
jgi:hypothetical protein